MLSLSKKFLQYIQRAHIKIAALVGIVTSVLSDEQHTQVDWEAGSQIDTTPTTTVAAQLLAGGAILTVANTSGFTCGSSGNAGYLILTDGTNVEIVYYTGSTATTFTGLARGQLGTTAQQWEIADTVYQLKWGFSENYDVQIAPKNWIQPDQSGGGTVNRAGAGMIYRPEDGCFYVFGGYDGANYQKTLYQFDPSTNVWTTITPDEDAIEARAYHSMIYTSTNGGEIWVTGGRDAATIYNDVWKYHFTGGSANKWQTSAGWNRPVGMGALYGSQACYTEGGSHGMIVAGGCNNLTPSTPLHYSFKCYYFDGTNWHALASILNGKYGVAFGAACWMKNEGQMLVVGREGNTGAMIGDALDPVLNVWGYPNIAYPPAHRFYGSMVYDDVNHLALHFAGESQVIGEGVRYGSQDLLVYNPVTNAWTGSANGICAFERESHTRHCAAWDSVNKEMVAWGGVVNSATPTWPTYKSPARFRWYWASVGYLTDVIDVGAVPDEGGMWILEDVYDTAGGLSAVAYTAEYSDDGINFTDIGVVKDGDSLSDLHRYWRVRATLTDAEGLNASPKVLRLDALYDKLTYYSLANRPVGDYPPIIESIGSLTSQADPVKCSAKIGGLTIGILNTSRQAISLVTNSYLKKKTVKIKLGVLEDDFAEADFQFVLKGRIKDWDFDGNVLSIEVVDFLGDMKEEIPQEADDGTITALVYNDGGIASNPVDIMLDILQNQLNVPDRDIDFDSFAAVKADASLAGWKFNRTITDPEDAYDLMLEICRHIGAILIPRENGKIALKILSVSADVVDVWNELDQGFRNPTFKGEADSIRNFISTWWHWDGTGDEWAAFEGAEVYTDAGSITNWGRETLRTMSKWLGDDGAPYFGDTLALAISQRILEMSKNGIPIVSLETNMSAFPVQVGDLIRVQSGVLRSIEEYREWQRVYDPAHLLTFYSNPGRYSIPYLVYGCAECIDMKWWVTKKNVDFMKGTIKWDLARARTLPLSATYDTQADWYKGQGDQVDLDTEAGSVLVAVDPAVDPLYFASGTYDLIIDMGQQPEQPGAWAMTVALDAGTDITYEAWASEYGAFRGEESSLGAVADGDPITMKTRYYKIRATLTANGGLNKTPKLQALTIEFTNG